MAMTQFSLTDLAKIIERDSKDSTYKFALLRDTIARMLANRTRQLAERVLQRQ
jgi:hypothetical protein